VWTKIYGAESLTTVPVSTRRSFILFFSIFIYWFFFQFFFSSNLKFILISELCLTRWRIRETCYQWCLALSLLVHRSLCGTFSDTLLLVFRNVDVVLLCFWVEGLGVLVWTCSLAACEGGAGIVQWLASQTANGKVCHRTGSYPGWGQTFQLE
jgi:hypothetical protein